jgi:hypothetical protein
MKFCKANSQFAIQNLENNPEIIEVDSLVRVYLRENPPTLGYGYLHLKTVARCAFQLAIANAVTNPELAYLAGLLHDLYRPAWGQAWNEQYKDITARQARNLLAKTQFYAEAETVAAAILNHEQAIAEGTSTKIMQVLSVANKMDMSFQRVVAYAWASNQFKLAQGKAACYESFEKIRDDFCLEGKKAKSVFCNLNILGIEEAIKAYWLTTEQLDWIVRQEKKGKVFFEEMFSVIVNHTMRQEKRCLEETAVGAVESLVA